MNFDYQKLNEFLDKLSEAEPFQTGPINTARDRFFEFGQLTNRIARLFNAVLSELDINVVRCTTDTQTSNLKDHYYKKLNSAFDRYRFCYDIFLGKAEETKIYKDGKEITLPNFSDSQNVRFEINEVQNTLASINTSIDRINKGIEPEKPAKDKLTHKQQILLLDTIGFFELPIFQSLTQQNKGILVSHILNRTEKDSEDLIRYLKGKSKDKKFEVKTSGNIKALNALLKKIGREDISLEPIKD